VETSKEELLSWKENAGGKLDSIFDLTSSYTGEVSKLGKKFGEMEE